MPSFLLQFLSFIYVSGYPSVHPPVFPHISIPVLLFFLPFLVLLRGGFFLSPAPVITVWALPVLSSHFQTLLLRLLLPNTLVNPRVGKSRFFFFLVEFHVAQASPIGSWARTSLILLPPFSKSWYYRPEPPPLASKSRIIATLLPAPTPGDLWPGL